MKRLGLILCAMLMLAAVPVVTAGAADADKGPAVNYIYMDQGKELDKDIVVVSLDTEKELSAPAKLFYKEQGSSQILTAESAEIKGNYALFLLEKSHSEKQLVKMQADISGNAYELALNGLNGQEELLVADEENNAVITNKDGMTKEEIQKAVNASSSKMRSAAPFARRANGKVRIVLDPGHGGSDSGAARAYNGVTYYEKNMTLKISQYTAQALAAYGDVEVYLTRTSDVAMSLSQRVNYAAGLSADLFVSQHINSTGEAVTSATGAKIIVSSGSYRPELAQKEKELGNLILNELSKIGFVNGGFIIRGSENGTTYPNGGLADYYGIIRQCTEAGIPGIIAEHGFINNNSDLANLLSSDAQLKRIGEADAAAIVQYFNLQLGEWREVNGVYRYYMPDGTYKTGWIRHGGSWYYADPDADGARVTGFRDISGVSYFFHGDGIMATGWTFIGEDWYYFNENGVMIRNGMIGTYYCGPDGKWDPSFDPGSWQRDAKGWWFSYTLGGYPRNEWIVLDGKWYHFDYNGYMQTGWVKSTNNWYYLGSDGAMLTNCWLNLGGTWYYLLGNGIMTTGWQHIDGQWYYLNGSGAMVTGWQRIGNTWYYLNGNGAMLTGWIQLGGTWYYLRESGAMAVGWVLDNGAWYFCNESGAMLKNTSSRIGNKVYQFGPSGVCLNP